MQPGILIRQWTWPLRTFFWWVLIVLGVWGFTMGAHWLWAMRNSPEAPLAYEQAVLDREVQALRQLTPEFFDPTELALWIGTNVRDNALMSSVGFARVLMNWPVAFRNKKAAEQAAKPEPAGHGDAGGQFVMNEVAAAGGTWDMLVTSTYIFAVRTAMYAAASPLLLLGAAIGVVDGLVARALRKATAGRESASIYHRAKLGLSFVTITGYIACLMVPSFAHPVGYLVPLALLLALMIRLQCAYYKKYL